MTNHTTPLVSCIMPTYNRRRFVSQAIWYFLQQDYAARELIIVDDGSDAVADLVPDDERVRYVRLEERQSIGAKRNLACEVSRGALIAHWDDDDWYAPNRLSLQVAALLASEKDVCGTDKLLFYKISAGQAWLYRYPPDRRAWLAGSTLLYRRSTWQAHPFPDQNVGEDTAFVWSLPPERLHVMTDHTFAVGIIHDRNTASKSLRSARWQRRPLSEVTQLLAPERAFYAALRHGRPAFRSNLPNSISSLHKKLNFSSIAVTAAFLVYDGYGSMAEYLTLGLEQAGAKVNIIPMELDLDGLSDEFKRIYQRSSPKSEEPVLYFSWPSPNLTRFYDRANLFVSTMWESSQLPQGWAKRLNQARAVIVPTRFVAKVCRNSGVTVPIEVVQLGIDPAVYHYQERPERAGLTTLIVGTQIPRKHTAEGIAAWKKAFADDPEARLLIKSRFQYKNYVPDDPRIHFVDSNETTRGILHWYQQADVLLALGNEGFGLPLVEGMATGLPVIALNSEGQSDICEEAGDYLLPVSPASWEASNEKPFGPAGIRGVPGVDDVAERLRWVATHRNEAREMGRAASAWVREHRNVWSVGPRTLEVLEQYIAPRQPLRSAHTLWVPSWRTPCGIAEYSAHIAQALPGSRVTPQAPNLQGVRTLHIEHEHTLFPNHAHLTGLVQQARFSGIPVSITEHTVSQAAQEWEREADALVSLTQHGADRLRKRNPNKRVEYIPLGCPTWFPPRKRERDRVIGLFGFLEPHKGFWQVLQVLRQLSETELLMFSYAKSSEVEARWKKASAGLPVRRISQFLPTSEVARRLAAEADILVFWYDEISHASASAAVRAGLATGVPVLASPTSWFRELREATYQPLDLLSGVQRLLDDTALRKQLTAAAYDYCHANSWKHVAERYLALWQSLEQRTK